MNAILELAADFNLCAKVSAEALNVIREIEIDIAIAERSADPESVRLSGIAKSEATSDWYRTYEDKKNAALALLKALDIAPHELKGAL
jgi:hypothetical protein